MASEDEDVKLTPGWPPWFTRRRRWTVFAVLVLAVFLWKYPRWALKRAHDHYIACVNKIYEQADGDPSACRQGLLLAIPRIVPWTRKEAVKLASTINYDVADDTLKLAARRDVDPAARDRAARDLIDAVNASPAPDVSMTTSSRLQDAGAARILVERAADLHDGAARRDALDSAVRLGDAAAFARIAALPSPKEDPPLADGAARCITHDPHAIEQLHETNNAFINTTHSSSVDAEFALAACDPKHADKLSVDDVWRLRLLTIAAVCGGEPATFNVRDNYFDDDTALAALTSLARDEHSDLDDLLGLISPRHEDSPHAPARAILSAWSLLATPTDWPTAPQWADDAAGALGKLAATVKPHKPRDNDPYNYGPASDSAREDPAGTLRYGQLLLDLEAAYGWTRRGDLTRARSSATNARTVAHSPGMDPAAPLFVVATLQLVGDWDAADEEIADLAAIAAQDQDIAGMLALQRALGLAHRGKLAEAYAVLDPLIGVKMNRNLTSACSWLRVALGLTLGKPLDIKLTKPKAKLDVLASSAEQLSYWYVAATTTDPKAQIAARWAEDDEPSDVELSYVMPAVYVVIGRAAGKHDVETWLDVITGRSISDPQLVASARAEAARWRGDTAAEKQWDDRLAAIRALPKDDCGEYVLRFVTKP